MVTFTKGFTLIELMIVVVIISILAAISYPSYQSYLIKSKRADMMIELQNIGQRIEAKKIEKRSYTNINQSEVLSSSKFPYNGTALYTIALSPLDAEGKLMSPSWVITASPVTTAQMKNDGTLTFNSDGMKCRTLTSQVCGREQEWNK